MLKNVTKFYKIQKNFKTKIYSQTPVPDGRLLRRVEVTGGGPLDQPPFLFNNRPPFPLQQQPRARGLFERGVRPWEKIFLIQKNKF
jgi:hypothetical protein